MLLKPWRLVFALAAASACDPNIPQSSAPSSMVVALFDPSAEVPIAPKPNDLALDPANGLIEVTDPADASEAEKQFNRYLRTLDGFPTEVTATQDFSAPLDPSSVTSAALHVYDVTDAANPLALPTPAQLAACQNDCQFQPDEVACTAACPTTVAPAISWDATRNRVSVTARWERARTYAVVLLGGSQGLRGLNGELVAGSSAFYLLRVSQPLVTCTDLSSATCRSTTSLIAGNTEEEERDKAVTLERARLRLKPALTALAKLGVTREQVVAGWTFSTVQMPIATFDPANEVVPFPNDLLMENGHVNLPADANDDSTTQQLKNGLNQLDGFSTTASLLTESSLSLGAANARLDGRTVDASQFRLVNLDNPAEAVPFTVACRSCQDQANPAGVHPDQVLLSPAKPLRPGTRYAALWLRGATGLTGRVINANSIFALARLTTPLVENNRSTVSSLDDATAILLEPLRQDLQLALGVADGLGIEREKVVLAWTFRTQSTIHELAGLATKPAEWSLPTSMEGGPGNLLDVDISLLQSLSNATGQDFHSHIRWMKEGEFTSANALDPNGTEVDLVTNLTLSTDGAFTATSLATPRLEKRRFMLSAPMTPKHADGRIPVVIFQHGYGQGRKDAAGIANTLAKAGYAVLSIDAPFHGVRSYCHSNNECRGGSTCSQHRCTDDLMNPSDGYRIKLIDLGFATVPDPLETPAISGNQFLSSTNALAARDHFRQQVIDIAQLIRTLQDTTQGIGAIDMRDGDNTVDERLDPLAPGYIGQSLGGIIGTLVAGAIPEIDSAVLNVPGASLIDIVTHSTLFSTDQSRLDAYLAARGKPVGSPAYEQFLDTVRWAMDPADPQNVGRHLIAEPFTHPVTQQKLPSKRIFVSWMKNDEVVPNFSTELLIRSIEVGTAPGNFKNLQYTGGDHVFLLGIYAPGPAALAIQAQTDAAQWVSQ